MGDYRGVEINDYLTYRREEDLIEHGLLPNKTKKGTRTMTTKTTAELIQFYRGKAMLARFEDEHFNAELFTKTADRLEALEAEVKRKTDALDVFYKMSDDIESAFMGLAAFFGDEGDEEGYIREMKTLDKFTKALAESEAENV